MDGPWIVQDHYLTVRKWHANFTPKLNTVDLTLAWIRLLRLSMVYYNDNALKTNVSCVGEPVKIDSNTTLAIKGKFARVCVQVELMKLLFGKIILDVSGRRWSKVVFILCVITVEFMAMQLPIIHIRIAFQFKCLITMVR